MGEESAAEKVYEAGLELINPGGDPGVLREAATAWKTMGSALDKMVTDLDRDWRRVKSSGAWTGPSADAFDRHWQDLKKAVEDTTPQCDDAAKHLNDAADSIEEINDQIHQIYLEIGISIGVSVGLSFLTMGFSAAAGAARAAQLAARAAQLAGRLGTILTRIAQSFRTIAQAMRGQRFIKTVLVNWAGNTGGSVITNIATGKDPGLVDAVWQGGVGALVGTGPGNAAGKLAARIRPDGKVFQGAVTGMTGNLVGGAATDGVKAATGDRVGVDDFLYNAGANVLGGAAGGAGSAGVYKHLDGMGAPTGTPDAPTSTPGAPDTSSSTSPDVTAPDNATGDASSPDGGDATPDADNGGHQNGANNSGYVPPSQRGPHFTIDGVPGGLASGAAGTGATFIQGEDEWTKEKIRKDFG